MELIFNPPRQVTHALPKGMLAAGDRRDASVYVYDDHIRMAVNVALAAERPLLVTGPPGSGKSSLALNVALTLGRNYAEEVITPRTQARDLLWRFDALRRLRDAQAKQLKPDSAYIDKGVIWEAFKPPRGRAAVVLLDEIDKADPDVPNSLLGVLGSLTFKVAETDQRINADPKRLPFVVLTTNEERELPKPFLRRCVVLELRPPDRTQLLDIANAHRLDEDSALAEQAAGLIEELANDAVGANLPQPGAAEYIDALRACKNLGVDSTSPEWKEIARLALVKRAGGPA